MHNQITTNLFFVTFILVCIGIVMIYSASSIYAWERYKDGLFFLKRHIIFVLLGISFCFLILGLPYQRLKSLAKPVLLFSILLLGLVLIPGIGKEVAGARRWFRFRNISFQPSEFANLAIVLYVADFVSRKEKLLKDFWKGFLPPILILSVIAGLILMQPDLGSALAIGMVVIIMLFIAKTNLTYLLGLAILALPLFYILLFNVPYRRMRILAFLNPWFDPKGSGFQIIQSQVALGSGGIFGMGLGHSKQKLFYLPAAHTDFIFSIIGEELGLMGTITIIILYIIFTYYGLKIIKNTQDRFGYFLGLGVLLTIIFKTIINMGVCCGILPTKGLPLPFISYGGSSFIFDIISVGILMNIGHNQDYL
ncbi:MAG: putative lipid II flippase FtsW [Candidatus Omnitrophica bacterium]|nr:putative lipid II flippase FtsW [Candidatus Omnitrophota bacterium]